MLPNIDVLEPNKDGYSTVKSMPCSILFVGLFSTTNTINENNEIARDEHVEQRRQAPRDMFLSNQSPLILGFAPCQGLKIEEGYEIKLSSRRDNTRKVCACEVTEQVILWNFRNWSRFLAVNHNS